MFFKSITIPSNVSFYQHNLLEPFPTEFLGQYDVVNARALVVALSHDEWEPALRNLTSLLRTSNQSDEEVCFSNFHRSRWICTMA